jgi:hypothetical protein
MAGGALPGQSRPIVVWLTPKVRAMAVNASPALHRAHCLALLIVVARRRAGPCLQRHAGVGADHGRHGSEAIGCPCASAKHLDRRLDWRQAIIAGCSMIMAWLQTRFSTGAASSGSSPWKGGELADHAAANRVRGDLDRRLVLRDSSFCAIRGIVRGPEQRIRRRSVRLRPASRSWRDRRTSRHSGIEHVHRTAGWRRMIAAQL